jgi:tetratricopeptide (TPR) repeat protein
MQKPQSHQLTAWLVWALILGSFLLLAARFPFAYVWATYEDLYGEWAQCYLYLAVVLLSVWLALRPSPYRWFHALTALVFFYGAGEEISWGQRLLGFSSPAVFEDYNLQEETNLHNFLTGPVSTWTNDLMQLTVGAMLVGYGLLYPLALRLRWSPALGIRQLGLVAPPLHIWPFFVTGAFFELGLLHFNEAEIAEILVGTAMMFTLAGQAFASRWQSQAIDGPLTGDQSRRLALNMALMVAIVAGLAVITTQILLNNPAQRTVIEQRVLNGYEKFGFRYQEMGLWARAADFYQSAYEARPDRTDLLDHLVNCLQTAGDTESARYHRFAGELLNRKLTPAKADSRNPSEQLALAASYREIGDAAEAKRRLDLALELARQQAEAAPSDAEAAYELGMVYEVMADYGQAREKYAKARALQPAEKRYAVADARVDDYLRRRP